MIKVYFVPVNSKTNDYINNIVNALEKAGIDIVNKSCNTKKEKIKNAVKTFGKVDFYHFNWIESRVASGSLKSRLKGAIILFGIKQIKKHNGHIAWTMHNKLNHDANKNQNNYYYTFLKKFIPLTDLIVIHAKNSKDILVKEYQVPEEKICYVPHGSYIEQNTSVEPKNPNNILTFLSFGSVTRYKNIPMLIRSFKSLGKKDSKLEIYGKCNDDALISEIGNEIGECKSIEFHNEFVPDNQVNNIFSHADVAVVPYDKSTMINSGVAIMALSQATPIISSDFGAIEDMADKDFVHMYRYNEKEDHFRSLTKEMENVYREWKNDPQSLKREGKDAFDYAKTSLSWDHIGTVIAKCYEESLEKR